MRSQVPNATPDKFAKQDVKTIDWCAYKKKYIYNTLNYEDK